MSNVVIPVFFPPVRELSPETKEPIFRFLSYVLSDEFLRPIITIGLILLVVHLISIFFTYFS